MAIYMGHTVDLLFSSSAAMQAAAAVQSMAQCNLQSSWLDMLPKHDGQPLSRYRGRALKPLFHYQDCPAQPCHRDGRHGLSVIIPVYLDYTYYINILEDASV